MIAQKIKNKIMTLTFIQSKIQNKWSEVTELPRISLKEEQSLNLALRQPWVWRANDFIFLCGWVVIHLPEFSRGTEGAQILTQIRFIPVSFFSL